MSLLDYPDKVAGIVFTVGCNFVCGFCHNSELVKIEEKKYQKISEEEILDFLKSRQGLLEGVVITGGEPTLQPDLSEFIRKIKALGFLIKIDTNGTNPAMIAALNQEKLVDFWAMDIKASFEKYEKIIGCPVNLESIKKSIELIKNSVVDCEFRSTVIHGWHTMEDIVNMAKTIEGAKIFVLQKFIPRERLVNAGFLNQKSLSDADLQKAAKECEKWVKKCVIR
ncbi:MAG: Anaerobic ribonucleoside-triphosphate reductase activating protein [Candidatus Magasanikbacteria bacterium GW2011_GWC2_41_17]|uniref:Anaerobic ribonucleoside-triphosphate reductase activating protein n=2 Tax=Candidatus Magasanikiibacteriota TaxID=1752731 RepID=A0A0G0WHZ7_9BACT|nr:MAG: Anaerobic ribonucleoside-triphosphate reductase activating protein [Candidatus Magasanikbacteria bacterium GW2011_GWC2_41_17]KKS12505.1 MAG: Anaerobic ribonucleoside-triphosphate reductase activating protein [Candidatus Magasanikbacteria bacterium GW2011_GWA2_41_55]